MKKNILYYLCFMLIGGLTISSCTKDEDENQFASIEDVRGAVINASVGGLGFYNLGDATGEITIDVDDFGEDVSSVTLLKSVNGGTPVEVTKVTTFPTTLNYSLTQALEGTGVAFADLAVGDNVLYTFADVTTVSGVYPSGRTLDVNITCPGQLTGTFEISTVATGIFPMAGDTYTGMVRFEDTGGGTYNVFTLLPGSEDTFFEDASIGAYYAGYGSTDQGSLPNGDGVGNVQVKETCGIVSYIGASQWDEIFAFSGLDISADGTVLTLTFANDYGEGGIATITRTDGTVWADNLSL